ncbi:PR domain zinc finger protein 10-like isoform X1 [Mizuhopecten yessoensis]|uniref:PR domain zinc finger protein 10 n=1 Tax=Mizuhopecten yessoensis TaxID=6573 RepID=A0A210QLK5_MIZYE|nr:PR domain zinc finger protein 10-like isoform X1 [Mizuhopecten yessoensis]XP_021355186.1 PR domain zinc finger protein 10-like isoform X1 [Mizuhopecten yessoensis]OWF49618.1 PR domain zinc finger protein 10 [Mizuhopecten yessoensis]
MDSDNHSNRNDVWTPPESTQGPRYSQEVGVVYTSGSASYAASASTAYASSSATSTRVSAPNYSRLQYGAPYSQSRVPFPDAYISPSDPQAFQAPQSSYERISPVNEYREIREVPSGSDPISSYSGMQAEASSMLTAPSVDSSTLGPGYNVSHVVMNSDHQRVMAVQRVISPVDCTVSQSAMANQDQQHQTHTLLAPVTSVARYPVGQVTSMPSYSHSEAVSSTGGSSLLSHGHSSHLVEREQDNGISSITGPPTQERRMISSTPRKTTHETISGEPDTTQDDGEEFQAVRNYMVDASPNLDDTELHSTMTQSHHPTSDLMDHNHSINSSHLSSSLHHSLSQTRMDNVQDRGIVDSSGIGSSSIVEGPSALMSVATLQRLGTSLVSSIDPDKDMSEMEIIPGPSGSQMQVRKSSRIADLENETTHWHHRPTYNPKPYNPNSLWCEECMMTYEPSCPIHRLQVIPDKVVLSRAWASLPPMLQIFRLSEDNQYPPDPPHVGVFAKRPLTKLTQFGPYIGDLVPNRESAGTTRFLLLLEKVGGDIMYFETSDENKCNWMMFVRPAETYAEQNMVAYQYGQDIYFSVTKNIETRGELKVWYASHYAERFGLQTLEITDQDLQTLDQQEYKYQCYDCSKRFKTSLALQRHIIVSHDTLGPADDSVEPSTSEIPRGKSYSFSQGYLKRRGRPPKKDLDTTGYMWKKKSTSIYLNKTLKKYQRRHDPEAIRRTIQSLYRKKGKESGGQEWVCVHCDLTFDNSNLLNLHTLTHAAEDVGLDEVRKFAYGVADDGSVAGGVGLDENIVSIDSSTLACPVCHAQFVEQRALIEHAAEHGTTKRRSERERPHKCDKCWKAFHTQETLQRHMLCHGDEDSKPLQCDVCFKRFMNNSALSCHLKTHSDKKYYQCPICHQGFDHTATMKEHVVEHEQDGVYTCPNCLKQFTDFISLRKHIRGFHTNKEFPCPHCDKIFPRPDKLKLHMLRHSTHREFMCETCGRQFKRKDKLKEHIRRMHSLEREVKMACRNRSSKKKFIPKVLPSDYHRFIYKCHTCMHGFKRRGMLVNHLAKRHPDVKPETVPELNLPILKTQKDYYCQYCEKVYKSSSKRKAHIIKNHPGADLPMSSRKKSMVPEFPGLPNPTYSQTVGSITTMPHSCEFCHKQYASKAKLTQHQRKKHPFAVPPLPPKLGKDGQMSDPQAQPNQDGMITQVVRYDQDTVIAIQPHPGQDGQPADLLTQAMSELTQSLQQEYRQMGEIQLQRVATGAPTMVTVQTAPLQHSTIELSHLSQALPQGITLATPIQMAVATQSLSAAPAPAPSDSDIQAGQVITSQNVTVTQQQQVINAPQAIVVSGAQGQTTTIPVSLATGFIQRAWTNFN